MPKAKKTKQQEEQPKEDMALCPCCGKPTIKKPIKVDSKIVDDYMASIITGVPFNHTFEMFDGKLRITVSSADREEGRVLYSFVFLVEPYSAEYSVLRDLLGVINAYCNITKITVSSMSNGDKIYFPAKHIVDTCKKLVEKWDGLDITEKGKKEELIEDAKNIYQAMISQDVLSSTPPMIIQRVSNDFRALETIMMEAGFDENFWKGIELA